MLSTAPKSAKPSKSTFHNPPNRQHNKDIFNLPRNVQFQLSRFLNKLKHCGITTVGDAFYLPHSRMDEATQIRLEKALESTKPDTLRGLKTAETNASIATYMSGLIMFILLATVTVELCGRSQNSLPMKLAMKSIGKCSSARDRSWPSLYCARPQCQQTSKATYSA